MSEMRRIHDSLDVPLAIARADASREQAEASGATSAAVSVADLALLVSLAASALTLSLERAGFCRTLHAPPPA